MKKNLLEKLAKKRNGLKYKTQQFFKNVDFLKLGPML